MPRLTFRCKDIDSEEFSPIEEDSTGSPGPHKISDVASNVFHNFLGRLYNPVPKDHPSRHDVNLGHSDMNTSLLIPSEYGDTFWRHMSEMRAMPVEGPQSWSRYSAFNISTNFHIAPCRGVRYSVNERARELSLNYEHDKDTARLTHNASAFCTMEVKIPGNEMKQLRVYFLEQTCTAENYVAINSEGRKGQWEMWTGCERQHLHGVSRPSRVMTVVIVLSDFTVRHKMALKIQEQDQSVQLTMSFDSPTAGTRTV